MKSRGIPRSKRYQGGGAVSSGIDPNYMSKQINQGFDTTRGAIGMANAMKGLMKGNASSDTTPKDSGSGPSGAAPADSSLTGGGGGGNPTAGARKGGPIKRTMGPKIGREDGLIAAQKGEYVIRKAAAKKLGPRVLSQVNKGKLPERTKR